MATESHSARYLNGLRRYALLLLAATVIVIALLRSAGPIEGQPWGLLRMVTEPPALPYFLGVVIAVALILEIGVRFMAWANPGDRSLSGTGIVSFLLGLLSGLCAFSRWLSIFGLLTAIPGLLLGGFAFRDERRRGAGHSHLNLTGIALNAANVITVVSRAISE